MILSSGRLQAEVAVPGVSPNTTCRFDRAGFITSVLLDGQYEFCTAEPENLSHPSSGGRGLCSEFLAPDMCEKAPPDDFFPKPGIGLLRRKGELPYCFYDSYEEIPFPIEWVRTEDSVTFTTKPLPCQGYEFMEIREIRVAGQQLTNAVTLLNTGGRAFSVDEYCHNFMTLMRLPLDGGYHIYMPGIHPQKPHVLKGILKGEGTGFTFEKYSPDSFLYTIPPEELLPDSRFVWKVTHDSCPLSVTVTDAFRPRKVSIWAADHLISVEVFRSVCLEPGEEMTWKRTWEFDASQSPAT